MFHEQVVAHYDKIVATIKDQLKTEGDKLCVAYPGCSNQIRRVAKRFALAIIAGKYACEWGAFPFPAEVVEKSVKACFDNWIENRGGIGAHEDIEAVSLVKNFIYANRLSRFERLDTATGDEELRQPVLRDLVGYADILAHQYFFYQDPFEKVVLKGLNVCKACKALLEAGLLRRDDRPSGNKVRKTFGGRRGFFYKIVLDDEPEDNVFEGMEAELGVDYAF
jgi:hypothetical protein